MVNPVVLASIYDYYAVMEADVMAQGGGQVNVTTPSGGGGGSGAAVALVVIVLIVVVLLVLWWLGVFNFGGTPTVNVNVNS